MSAVCVCECAEGKNEASFSCSHAMDVTGLFVSQARTTGGGSQAGSAFCPVGRPHRGGVAGGNARKQANMENNVTILTAYKGEMRFYINDVFCTSDKRVANHLSKC